MKYIHPYGTKEAPFEVAMGGYGKPDDELPRACEVPMTILCLGSIRGMRGGLDEIMTRVRAGPPGYKGHGN